MDLKENPISVRWETCWGNRKEREREKKRNKLECDEEKLYIYCSLHSYAIYHST